MINDWIIYNTVPTSWWRHINALPHINAHKQSYFLSIVWKCMQNTKNGNIKWLQRSLIVHEFLPINNFRKSTCQLNHHFTCAPRTLMIGWCLIFIPPSRRAVNEITGEMFKIKWAFVRNGCTKCKKICYFPNSKKLKNHTIK